MSLPSFQQYQAAFTGYIRQPSRARRPAGVNARRMDVYAELVYNNLKATVSACFPVARKVLGVRRWNRIMRLFLMQHACATPIFRQIPEEFLSWLDTAESDDIPPWLRSLAHYEWVELALAVSEATVSASDQINPQGDLLAGRPVLAPALLLLSYPYAVHRISPRYKPEQPDVESTHILAFRRDIENNRDEVKFIELNPVSARLVALLSERRHSGAEALQAIVAEMKHPRPEVVVQGGLLIMENLRQERAILGVTEK
jgi:hypothetical protein